MSTITCEISQNAPLACLPPWLENPYRLVSLLDMLRFNAHHFVAIADTLATLRTEIEIGRTGPTNDSFRKSLAQMSLLIQYCKDLNLVFSLAHLERLASRLNQGGSLPWNEFKNSLEQLTQRVWDELEQRRFLQIDPAQTELYDVALDEAWLPVCARFGCQFDVEEARKCIALGRSTAAVFHLMRVVEHAVLELQCFLDKTDHKAHFGSVLKKIDDLNRKTDFAGLPTHLQPFRAFLQDILPQMYAVKNAWRDRVSHVDGRIIPSDMFTEGMSKGVYDATLLLMQKLASGLP